MADVCSHIILYSHLPFDTRCSDEGLFHDEIEDYKNHNVLTKCFMSYSREPGKPKEHTTDRLQTDRIKTVLAPILSKKNTHIFICGSASMAGEYIALDYEYGCC